MENSQCCPKCFMNGTDYDQLEDLLDLYQVEQITPRSFKDARIKNPPPSRQYREERGKWDMMRNGALL